MFHIILFNGITLCLSQISNTKLKRVTMNQVAKFYHLSVHLWCLQPFILEACSQYRKGNTWSWRKVSEIQKKTQSKTQKFSSFYFLHQFFWLYRIYVLPGIHFSLSLFHLDNCTYFFNHQKFTYSFVNWVFYLRILETFSCVSYCIIFYGHYSFARMYNNLFN